MIYQKGFTLMEIIIVLGIFAFIVSFGVIVDLNVLKRDALRAEQSVIVSTLEKARSRAMSNIFETRHGVCYLAPNYVIFRNRSACLPISSTDEVLPANIGIAEASDFSNTFPTIVFSQLAGTTTGASIQITDGSRSLTISTNYEGTINW